MDRQIEVVLDRIRREEDDDRRQALMDEHASMLGQHFARNHDDREELAYELLNIAWTDRANEALISSIIEVKTVGLGEVDYLSEDLRGMWAYWQGKGGQILSSEIRYEREAMPREEIVSAIDYHNDDLELNFWGEFGRLTDQAQEKMRALPVYRLVELIQAGVASGPTYGTFAASTLTAAQVDSVLDPVASASKGQVTIMGTSTAVRKLSRIGLQFGQNLQEQIFRTGIIGGYSGYNVVQVENFENFDGYRVLPDDEIWLVGRNAGRLTYYGANAKVQQLRLPSFRGRWESARDAGMLLLVGRNRLGRIVLT